MQRLILLTFLSVGLVFNYYSQNETQQNSKLEIIRTNDGGEFVGVVISEDEREILIDDKERGRVYIPKYSIKSREEVNSENFGKSGIIRKNEFAHIYNITPSAIPIKKGDDVIKTYYFALVQYEHGFSDRFSLGFGTSYVGFPFYLTGKYNIFSKGNKYLTFNQKIGTITVIDFFDYSELGSLSSINYTIGTREKNISFGAGYLKFSEEISTGNNFYANLSGISRVAKNISFIYEFAALFTEDSYVATVNPNLRLFTKKGNAWDFSLLMAFPNDYDSDFDPTNSGLIPVVGYNHKF